MEKQEGKKEGSKKKMAVLQAHSLRDMIQEVNEAFIQKEDIVQVLEGDNGYFLLYYK